MGADSAFGIASSLGVGMAMPGEEVVLANAEASLPAHGPNNEYAIGAEVVAGAGAVSVEDFFPSIVDV